MASGGMSFGPLSIDLDRREVYVNENPVELTLTEFSLLRLFGLNPGKVFTRDELLSQVWGESFFGDQRTVDSHVNHLRKKIFAGSGRFIQSVRGVGYKFVGEKTRPAISAPPVSEVIARTTLPLKHNLPVSQTPFVGRKVEIREISKLLLTPKVRLLTLLGPGGIGKTRLAIQAAFEIQEQFPDGAFFVPLASIAYPDFIVSTIAKRLSFSFYERESAETQLLNFLREKEMLVIMDNCEHLEKGIDFFSRVLLVAPKLKILATSRERLNLQEEITFAVGGMHFPEDRAEDSMTYDAVRLFEERAKRLVPDFALAEEDMPHVVAICRMLSGMPLGIELAASWVRALSCKEIAAEMKGSFDFLESEVKDLPERHKSLRAAFDHSWALLKDDEQILFRRLSIFPGSFEKDAAEKIAGATPKNLLSLIDKSLLWKDSSGRFRMHEVLRRHAVEKLKEAGDEDKEVHQAFLGYYAEFMEVREKILKGSGNQRRSLDEITEEIENVRAAWEVALPTGLGDMVARSAETLSLYYQMRSLISEGEKVFRAAVEAFSSKLGLSRSDPANPALLGRLLIYEGIFNFRAGQHKKAKELIEEGLNLIRPLNLRKEIAYAEDLLTRTFPHTSPLDKKISSECLSVYEEFGDSFYAAKCLLRLATVSIELGEYEEAERYAERSFARFQEIGDRFGAAYALGTWGLAAHNLGRYGDAHERLRQSLLLHQENGNEYGEATCLLDLGYVSKVLRNLEEARTCFMQSFSVFTRLGARFEVALSHLYLASVSHSLGDISAGKTHAKKSLEIFKAIEDPWGISTSLDLLGRLALAGEDYSKAEEYLSESLNIAFQTRGLQSILRTVVSWAEFFLKHGESRTALEILSLVLVHPAAQKGTSVRAGRIRAALKEVLPPHLVEDEILRGKSRNLDDQVEAILSRFAHNVAK